MVKAVRAFLKAELEGCQSCHLDDTSLLFMLENPERIKTNPYIALIRMISKKWKILKQLLV